jgi:hypothetical protein
VVSLEKVTFSMRPDKRRNLLHKGHTELPRQIPQQVSKLESGGHSGHLKREGDITRASCSEVWERSLESH